MWKRVLFLIDDSWHREWINLKNCDRIQITNNYLEGTSIYGIYAYFGKEKYLLNAGKRSELEALVELLISLCHSEHLEDE